MLAGMISRCSIGGLGSVVLVCLTWGPLVACRDEGRDLTVAQLTAVVSSQQASLKPCYQAALDKQPDSPEFRIQATIHVQKDGKVGSVELERGGLPTVGSCVEKVVRTWRFPPAGKDTYASMPIIFRPTIEPMQEAPKNPFE
jgi:hypothetical protein